MDARAARLAENQAVFRDINERIANSHELFHSSEPQEFICECAQATCTKRIWVGLSEYERVRASPRRFLIAPGHELPGVEEVVESRQEYAVIEKLGSGRRGR